jgi:tetratricopeptide (TPR) repeat protein
MAAVDEMLTEVGAVDLADVPQMEPVRRRLLANALVFFNDFLRERGDDPSVRFEAARAYGRCGDILALEGQTDDARDRYERAVALLEQVPAGPEQRRELGRTQTNLGALLKKAGRFAEAEEAYGRALALRQGLADESPDRPEHRQELASTRYLLGALLAPRRGRQKEAADCYAAAREAQQRLAEEVPTELEYQRDLARTLNNLGMLQWDTGRRVAADSLGEAERLQRALVEKAPRVPHYRRELARTLLNSATRLMARREFAAARTAGEEARDLLRRLVNDYATVPEYRYELAGTQRVLGRLLREQGHVREAEDALRDAVALCEELCKEVPAEPRYGSELGVVNLDLGVLLEDTGRPGEAEAAYRRGLDVQRGLATRFPDIPAHHADLADTRESLGQLLARRARDAEVSLLMGALLGGAARDPWGSPTVPARAAAARSALEEARDLLRGAVTEQQQAIQQLQTPSPRYQEALRNHYFWLTEIDLQLGEHAEAAEAAERQLPGRPADYALAAESLVRCASLAADDPRLPPEGRHAAQQKYADRAVELLQQGLKLPGARPAETKALLEQMRQERFDPLRGRVNFRRLLEEAEKAAKVGVG